LTEIHLCASCSCHEILRSATARVRSALASSPAAAAQQLPEGTPPPSQRAAAQLDAQELERRHQEELAHMQHDRERLVEQVRRQAAAAARAEAQADAAHALAQVEAELESLAHALAQVEAELESLKEVRTCERCNKDKTRGCFSKKQWQGNGKGQYQRRCEVCVEVDKVVKQRGRRR
jgi:DNA repair exonuclease SbcCD ATPase subunit